MDYPPLPITAAVVISALLHISGYVYYKTDSSNTGATPPQVDTIQIQLRKIALHTPAPVVEQTPAPPKPALPKHVQPVRKSKPLLRNTMRSDPKVLPPPAEPMPMKATTAVKTRLPANSLTATSAVQKTPVAAQTASEKEQYLAALLAHIERHKFYPTAARKRGLEGTVQVSFQLTREGGLQALSISGGAKPLRFAANHSVHEALPFPLPPSDMTTPLDVRIGMVYSLDNITLP